MEQKGSCHFQQLPNQFSCSMKVQPREFVQQNLPYLRIGQINLDSSALAQVTENKQGRNRSRMYEWWYLQRQECLPAITPPPPFPILPLLSFSVFPLKMQVCAQYPGWGEISRVTGGIIVFPLQQPGKFLTGSSLVFGIVWMPPSETDALAAPPALRSLPRSSKTRSWSDPRLFFLCTQG